MKINPHVGSFGWTQIEPQNFAFLPEVSLVKSNIELRKSRLSSQSISATAGPEEPFLNGRKRKWY